MGELYETDVLEWSEHQAWLLRQHVAGEPGNETPDWTNIIEEVESVGRSQLSAVKSLLVQAIDHDLKCEAWPLRPYVPHGGRRLVAFEGTPPKPPRRPCGSESMWRICTGGRWTVCLRALTGDSHCLCQRRFR
jgi:hypothetical protein